MNKIKSKKMMLPVDILNVDKYQKRIRENIVRKIVNDFKPSSVGVIHVSKRKDGTYWIFDGQHRHEAYKRMGTKYADCLVFEGMSYQEEVEAFNKHQDSSKPTPYERFMGEYYAENPKHKDIIFILGRHNLELNNASGTGRIIAVNAVVQIYERGGPHALDAVLRIIKSSFGLHTTVFQRPNLFGMYKFINTFDGQYDEKSLIRKLKKSGLDGLTTAINQMKLAGFNPNDAAKRAIVRIYNYRLSDDKKLMQ